MTDELIEEIIEVLDTYARAADYEYGLPRSSWCVEEMVDLVKQVINKED